MKAWTKFRQTLCRLSGNTRIILRNSVAAFLIKGAGVLISVFSMPAFLRYFNDQSVLGVWYTILGVVTWIDFFDLGIGNGLRNSLVDSFTNGRTERAQQQISTAYLLIGLVSVLLMAVGLIAAPLLKWNVLLNIQEEVVSPAVLALSVRNVFVGVTIHFFLKLISSVIYALQKSALNHLLSLSGSILRLAFVLLAPSKDAEANLLMLSQAYVFLACLPYLAATVAVFATKLREVRPRVSCFRWGAVREIAGVGGIFFVCQLLYMLLVNTNDFCIAYFTDPANTTEYNIYFKLFSLAGTLAQVALTPVWSAVTKAFLEKSYAWLRQLYRKCLLCMPVILSGQLLLVCILQPVVNLWLGSKTIAVRYDYALIFALWGTLFTLQNVLSTFVCGLGRLKLQLGFYAGGVVLKYLFLIVVYRYSESWILVMLSNILVMLPYCVAQHMQLQRNFNAMEAENVQR